MLKFCGMFQFIFKNIAIFLANFIQVYIFCSGIFYLFLSFSAIIIKKRLKKSLKNNKFAVLIIACNEERVIRFSIDSLKKMNYPKDSFSVYVVADHCADNTVQIARSMNVEVMEHLAQGGFQSKGRAMKWATKKILDLNKYDAICYFDADSLAHEDYLTEINKHVNSGEKVIQGRQLAKNKTDGWLPKILAVGHLLTNIFFQSPKYALGFSATLHGKGMCFSADTAKKFHWDEVCLTEDLEMQMRLIVNGIRITWSEAAIIYDEEPVNLKQYIKRAVRWTRGSLDTARRHLSGLFFAALFKRDLKALEGALYCSNVYRFSVASLMVFLIYYTRDSFNLIIWFYHALPGTEFTIKILAFVPLILYPLAVLISERAEFKMLIAYFLQPVLGVFRIPVFLAGVFRTKAEWGITEHQSSVGIDDIVK
ncbi:MAG: glycosyltransferase family 2 protein [Elusimicrobiota bacterium]|nr:glycosyltransferase family 2 protein [Elusimicrobiota bacterium]